MAAYVVGRLLSRFAVRAIERAQLDQRVAEVVGKAVFYFVMGVAVLWALGGIGLTLLLLLVVLGFALSDVIQNLGAGLMIMATGFTREGDWVLVNGFEGDVVAVTWRGTVIQTFDNRQVMIPNVDVVKNSTVNYSRARSLRQSIWLSVDPEADLDQAEQVILEALSTVPDVLSDPEPQVLVSALYSSATNLEVRLWVRRPYDPLPQILSEATHTIKKALGEHGIQLAMPTAIVVPTEMGRMPSTR